MAAPDALHVAERFHLVRNVREALKALRHAGRWHLPATCPQPELSPHTSTTPSVSRADPSPKAPQPTPRKRALWEAVQRRRGLGPSLRQSAQALGMDRRTGRKYLAADQPLGYPARRPRPPQLPPYLGYLAGRWAQGCHNARRLYHELVPRGYRGSEGRVRMVVRPWRTRQGGRPPALTAAQRSRLILQPTGHLTAAERAALPGFLRANARLAQGYELKRRFPPLLTDRHLGALEPWLQQAEGSALPSFQTRAHTKSG